jgi:hypothetical protein
VLSVFLDPDCATGTTKTLTVSSACTGPTFGSGGSVAAPEPSGTCTASGGTAAIAAPSWGTAARACMASVTTGSCGAGACVANPPSGTSICILQSGVATTCPAGYNAAAPQVFYTGVDDTRGCSACTCGSVSGVSCNIGSPAINLFGTPSCSTATSTLSAPSDCTVLPGEFYASLASGAPTLSGTPSCSVADGGTPTGSANPTGPTSFCCLP